MATTSTVNHAGSATADLLNTRIRISDPKPDICSACHTGADAKITFLDFDAAHDGGVVINDQGAVLVSADDLHLCEQCVRAAAETLGLKPQLHTNQAREIRRLEHEVDHWKDYAKTLEATLADRPEPAPRAKLAGAKLAGRPKG